MVYTIVYCSQLSSLHSGSLCTIAHSVYKSNMYSYGLQVLTNSLLEPPSRTTPNLGILFMPPVYKTYIFLQDFSSRDNLILSVKADALKLSIKYD